MTTLRVSTITPLLVCLLAAGNASAQQEPPPPPTIPNGPPPASTLLLPTSVPPSVSKGGSPPASPETPAGTNVPLATTEDVSAEEHARIDNSPAAHDGHPLAGYHNGLFFLRDHHDNFHLYIQGRSQIDFYGFLGPGVPQTTLKPTLFLRRVRPEVTGEFLGHWRFMIAGDFGATAIDNPKGTNETSAAAPGAAPSATSARFATAETVRFQAQPTDVFVNYRNHSIFNVMVGQMDAPFTMENRTSDKYIPFMERSLAVRAVGIPTNKEIGGMFWGETENRIFYYSVGPYMGDGQNRPNVDSRFDVFGRTFIHPLATADIAKSNPIRDMQLGGSIHYGSRDKAWVDYDYPGLSTQGQYTFWSATYTGVNGPTHITPSGDQIGVAGELRVPIENFDFTSELVYIHNNTREFLEGTPQDSERFGTMKGYSYYLMAGYWLFGPRDINGVPGYGNPPRLDWSKVDPVTPDQALQLLVKWEQVHLNYNSASRSAHNIDPKGIDGAILADAISFGANYWATKHVRLSLNYVWNYFPDSAPTSATSAGAPVQSSAQRAMAPGNTLGKGIDDTARNDTHTLHEILARIAIAL